MLFGAEGVLGGEVLLLEEFDFLLELVGELLEFEGLDFGVGEVG